MEKIELRKARDFGQLFNDSINFLRINFKSFFGIILFLAGPFVILTGLLMGYLQFIAEKLGASNLISTKYPGLNIFVGNSISTTCIFILIFLLTTLVTNASIALYFKFYDTANPNELPLQRINISPFLTSASFRLFYNLLLLILVSSVIILAFVGVCYLLFLIPAIKIIAIAFMFVGYLILIPALIYVLTVANFIVIRDEVLITAAIGKVIRYMRGNFWWTWLLMFCTLISLTMLYFLFNMPYLVLTMISTFTRRSVEARTLVAASNSLWYVVFGALSTLGSMLVISPIFTCFCVFNFYNHEERHEGTSLMNRIDMFDKN
jgi:hypothetical protein